MGAGLCINVSVCIYTCNHIIMGGWCKTAMKLRYKYQLHVSF